MLPGINVVVPTSEKLTNNIQCGVDLCFFVIEFYWRFADQYICCEYFNHVLFKFLLSFFNIIDTTIRYVLKTKMHHISHEVGSWYHTRRRWLVRLVHYETDWFIKQHADKHIILPTIVLHGYCTIPYRACLHFIAIPVRIWWLCYSCHMLTSMWYIKDEIEGKNRKRPLWIMITA